MRILKCKEGIKMIEGKINAIQKCKENEQIEKEKYIEYIVNKAEKLDNKKMRKLIDHVEKLDIQHNQ